MHALIRLSEALARPSVILFAQGASATRSRPWSAPPRPGSAGRGSGPITSLVDEAHAFALAAPRRGG